MLVLCGLYALKALKRQVFAMVLMVKLLADKYILRPHLVVVEWLELYASLNMATNLRELED
jgi:hypothetical protein